MGRKVSLLWAFLLLTLHSAAALADTGQASPEAENPPPYSEEVIESAQRIPGRSINASRFPGQVTVITAEELAKGHFSNTPAALSYAAGVSLFDQQGFGLGADSTLNLRGVNNSSRTNAIVLVDGVKQNRVTGDEVHWQSIPVDQIERIEIIRGGGALIYGEGALTGVINIVTKQDSKKKFETEEEVGIGSFGWQRYSSNIRGNIQPLRYSTNVTRQLLTGYRESSQSRATTITTHTGIDWMPEFKTDLHVLHSTDTTSFPGLLTLAQTQQRRIQTNSFHGVNTNEIDQVAFDITSQPIGGFTSLVTLYWRRWVQTSQDSTSFDAFTITPSRGINMRGNYEWAYGEVENLLVSGLELTDDKATTGSIGIFSGQDSESNKSGYGLYFEDTLTLFNRLSLVGGMRYDRARFAEDLVFPSFTGTLRFEGWSPKAGVRFVAIPHWLDLFLSYSRPFKSPNVDDFSSRLGSSFSGNADLQPQQADTWEWGAQLTRGNYDLRGTFFNMRTRDEILFNAISSTNQNFNTYRTGAEFSGRAQPKPWLRLGAAYTVVEAEFRKGPFAGNTISGTPRHTAILSAGVSPLPSLWVDLGWQIVNDFYRFNDFKNQLGKADNFGVLNLVIQYELPKAARFKHWPSITSFLRIENLTNEEYAAYQSSTGNSVGAGEAPSPSTGFFGGLQVKF